MTDDSRWQVPADPPVLAGTDQMCALVSHHFEFDEIDRTMPLIGFIGVGDRVHLNVGNAVVIMGARHQIRSLLVRALAQLDLDEQEGGDES